MNRIKAMRISPHILITLRREGDKKAAEAWKQWLKLISFQAKPVMVACYYSSSVDEFFVGLIWESNKNVVDY